jgi:hypothetical protein
VLVHHADAGGDRVARVGEADRSAVDLDGPLVRPLHAVQDLHQRRLAGAVLPHDRVHLAGAHGEVDVAVGDHAGEPLRDPLEADDGLGHAAPSTGVRRAFDGR